MRDETRKRFFKFFNDKTSRREGVGVLRNVWVKVRLKGGLTIFKSIKVFFKTAADVAARCKVKLKFREFDFCVR